MTKKTTDTIPAAPDRAGRARERVEDLRKAVANAINLVENPLEMMKFECDENKWNDEVCAQIEEAVAKLGFALATLTTWYDGDGVEDGE